MNLPDINVFKLKKNKIRRQVNLLTTLAKPLSRAQLYNVDVKAHVIH